LDDLSGDCIFKVQGQRRVELAGIEEGPCDFAMREFLHFDLHVESLVGVVAKSEQETGRVAQHPVADKTAARIREPSA
jgi:hypothetical protein